MKKILIFAGTTEGRILCEQLISKNIPVSVSVATEYGETVLPKHSLLEVFMGRLNQEEMKEFILSNQFDLVVDATHPYAVEVTNNIREACGETKVRYLRLIRESIDAKELITVNTSKEAAEFLNSHEGNALITTGSKELEAFTLVKDYEKRLTVRVLPSAFVVKSCTDLGFQGRNLICMQGPFSEEMNRIMIQETNSSYLVTKEAGTYGGFLEKINAAKKAGARVIVIKRPDREEGFSMEEVLAAIEAENTR